MAKTADVKDALLKSQDIEPANSLSQLIQRTDVKRRFEDLLGKRGPAFLASLLSIHNGSNQLKLCDPKSILSAAAVAAALDLPINPNLGFAAIVPYKNQAQFQMMWRGFVQLAMRTGLYLTMNATEVYEGELVEYNRITGETKIDAGKRK